MPDRIERRAADLKKGDRLDLKGHLWTVTKAKTKGKAVELRVERGREGFSAMVKPKHRYTVVVEASAPARGRHTEERAGPQAGPLLDSRGAMTRWARDDEAREVLEPPAEPKRTSPWDKVDPVDRVLMEELGAKLVGVEVEGGKLVVPPVTDATIFGHLLTMHGRRFDGATIAEAKEWAREHDAAGTKTAAQVLSVLDFEKAYKLHDDIHGDLLNMPRPHWHREKAPR